jgi:hypothetical protein
LFWKRSTEEKDDGAGSDDDRDDDDDDDDDDVDDDNVTSSSSSSSNSSSSISSSSSSSNSAPKPLVNNPLYVMFNNTRVSKQQRVLMPHFCIQALPIAAALFCHSFLRIVKSPPDIACMSHCRNCALARCEKRTCARTRRCAHTIYIS